MLSYHEGFGDAYGNYGVDKEEGCAVIMRPDQYVAWVGGVDDFESMERFFGGFMVEQEEWKGGRNGMGGEVHEEVNGSSAGKETQDAGLEATDEAVVGTAAA